MKELSLKTLKTKNKSFFEFPKKRVKDNTNTFFCCLKQTR